MPRQRCAGWIVDRRTLRRCVVVRFDREGRQTRGRGHRSHSGLHQESAATEGSLRDQRSDPRSGRADPGRSGKERRFGEDGASRRFAPRSRGSGPTTTSDPEPDHQRCRSNVHSQRGGARIDDKHREGRFAQRAGGCARLGPGLPPAPERLFEPFYTTKSSGLGLGLSICHLIVEEHGGRFWASANLCRGAVFQFTVPAHPGSAS